MKESSLGPIGPVPPSLRGLVFGISLSGSWPSIKLETWSTCIGLDDVRNFEQGKQLIMAAQNHALTLDGIIARILIALVLLEETNEWESGSLAILEHSRSSAFG